MSYESIALRNKELYAELEENTRQLSNTDTEYFIKRSELHKRRKELKALIEKNLDEMFGKDLRRIRKIQERPYYQRVADVISMYPDAGPDLVGGLCRIKPHNAIKAINYLKLRHVNL